MNAPETGTETPAVAIPPDPTDTERVRRARARWREEPGSELGPSGRDDLGAAHAADPHGLEWSTLRAIYESIDKRANNRVYEAKFRREAEIAQKIADHERAKPGRWKALTPTARLLYWIAADDACPDAISRLLTRRIVPLLARDLSAETPPDTFEPQSWTV